MGAAVGLAGAFPLAHRDVLHDRLERLGRVFEESIRIETALAGPRATPYQSDGLRMCDGAWGLLPPRTQLRMDRAKFWFPVRAPHRCHLCQV